MAEIFRLDFLKGSSLCFLYDTYLFNNKNFDRLKIKRWETYYLGTVGIINLQFFC